MIRAILAFVLGLILGLAGCMVPRFWNYDLFTAISPKKESPAASAKATQAAPADPIVVPKELELRRMIAEVSKQRTALEERERPLAEAAARVDQEHKALEALKQEIDAAERRLKSATLEIDANELVNLKKLAKTWAQMDPTETAKLIKGVEPDLAVKILATMPERQVGGVIGALTADPEGEKLAVSLTTRMNKIKSATLAKKE